MVIQRYIIIVLAAALALCGSVARAQQPEPTRALPTGMQISATVEPKDPVEGDYLHYRVLIIGPLEPDKFEYPPWNSIDGVQNVQGPSETTMMVNGQAMFARDFRLLVTKKGKVTIPPARVRINGYMYETNAVELNIREVPAAGAGLEGVISARSMSMPQLNEQLRGKYFAKAEAPADAAVGQIVPVTIYIYRDPALAQFAQYDITQEPSGSDFLFPQPDRRQSGPLQANWERVSLGGKDFLRMPLHTFFAIPTKSGTLRLTPPQMRIFFRVQNTQRRSPMDDFLGMGMAQTVDVQLPLRPMEIAVKKPPEKPADAVLQVVGDVNVKVAADREELSRRELLTVTIGLAGTAYMEILTQPEISVDPKLTLLDKKTEAASVVDKDEYIAQQTFSYIYQAVEEGTVTIPPVKVAVFNPSSGKQEIVASAPITVKVNPADSKAVLVGGGAPAAGGPAGPNTNRAEARVLGQDVAYIDTTPLSATAIAPRSPFYTRPWFWVVQLLPICLALGYGIVTVRARHGAKETESSRTKRGRRAAEVALRDARKDLGTARRDEFYSMLHHGIMNYAASLLGKSPKGLTVDEAVDQLKARGSSPEACDRMRATLIELDAVRYSPAPDTPEAREKTLKEIEALLVDLTREEARAA